MRELVLGTMRVGGRELGVTTAHGELGVTGEYVGGADTGGPCEWFRWQYSAQIRQALSAVGHNS